MLKGKYIRSKEHREFMRNLNLGRKHSEETKNKLCEKRKNRIGEKAPNYGKKHTVKTRLQISKKLLGRVVSKETRLRQSYALKGEKCYNWQGGKTSESHKIRNSLEYREWRKKIFERDNYTCQKCGKRGVFLNADHIKPFSIYPELRFVLSNGQTLCKSCHHKTDSFGSKIHLNY